MEKWEKKFNELISGFNPGYRISGTMMRYYIINPSIVYCEYHVDKTERDPPNRSIEIRFEEGNEFEEEIYQEKNILEVGSFDDPMDTFREAIRLMYKGTKSLGNFNILIEKEGIHIKPDILERIDDGNSNFGNFYYRVIEIKSAKHINLEHVMQAALYTYVIGIIQGFFPITFDLINGNKEIKTYNFNDYRDKVIHAIDDIRKIYDKRWMPEFVFPGSNSSKYHPWGSFHTKIAMKYQDISLIPNVGIKMRQNLINNGFTVLNDIINSTIEDLTSLDNIGIKRAKDFKGYAQAIKNNEIIIIKDKITSLLNEKISFFIDFEGIPAYARKEDMNGTYLIGIGTIESDNIGISNEYSYFVEDITDKALRIKMFQDFINKLEDNPDAKIIHWGSYEKICLKKELPELGMQIFLKPLLDRMVDAEALLKQSFYLPTPGTSLKYVSKYFGYIWGEELDSGVDSIGMYLDYTQISSSSLKETLIEYNLHDVRAMYHTIKSLKNFIDNA